MKNVILLRTNHFGPREGEFLEQLRTDTGYETIVLADEMNGRLTAPGFKKIAYDRTMLYDLGLHCPKNAGWRCGDYGFYLARQAIPDARYFWMIEPDVRAAVENYADLFASFESLTADFIAPGITASDNGHFWYPTMRWLTKDVYRCHFAFCRMSAAASDACLRGRREMRFQPAARFMWPNDETFVATTLMYQGMSVQDLNATGRVRWTDETFGFQTVCRGEAFEDLPQTGLLYHPVLWGDDAKRKQARHGKGLKTTEVIRLKLLRGLNRVIAPGGAAI